jgi:hypothetical protein
MVLIVPALDAGLRIPQRHFAAGVLACDIVTGDERAVPHNCLQSSQDRGNQFPPERIGRTP